MSWMRSPAMLESVWKLALKSLAMWSGGSSVSWSLTPAARTVSVHCASCG